MTEQTDRDLFVDFLRKVNVLIEKTIERAQTSGGDALVQAGSAHATAGVPTPTVSVSSDLTLMWAIAPIDPSLVKRVAVAVTLYLGDRMFSGPLGEAGQYTLDQVLELAKLVMNILS